MIATLPRLLLVTDRRRTGPSRWLDPVLAAIAGGARWIQLREHDLPDAEVRRALERLRGAAPAGIRLSLNRREELALAEGCGLHLPAGRSVSSEGREALRASGQPCGRSVHDLDELREALGDEPDYLIAGTVFSTSSKPGLPGRGPAWVRAAAAAAQGRPVYAIGGVQPDRVEALRAAGAAGVAVCGAVLGAPDPSRAAAEFIGRLGGP